MRPTIKHTAHNQREFLRGLRNVHQDGNLPLTIELATRRLYWSYTSDNNCRYYKLGTAAQISEWLTMGLSSDTILENPRKPGALYRFCKEKNLAYILNYVSAASKQALDDLYGLWGLSTHLPEDYGGRLDTYYRAVVLPREIPKVLCRRTAASPILVWRRPTLRELIDSTTHHNPPPEQEFGRFYWRPPGYRSKGREVVVDNHSVTTLLELELVPPHQFGSCYPVYYAWDSAKEQVRDIKHIKQLLERKFSNGILPIPGLMGAALSMHSWFPVVFRLRPDMSERSSIPRVYIDSIILL